jgi:glycogen operon protein
MNFSQSTATRLLEGRSEPMGSSVRDGGVNFAVFSQHAQRIELCLFDSGGTEELQRIDLYGPHDGVFHGFLPDTVPGLVYGFRAHGRSDPHAGHRFNPHKVLLDPCAREIVGRFEWQAEHHGYTLGHADGSYSFDVRDNAASALKARVAPSAAIAPGWHNAPRHVLGDVVLYEVHVKGFSKLHPEIPPALQGTYAGLAHPASIAHFKSLGVTTLSLLPVQYCIDEPALPSKGLCNYWGYNTLGFFSPDPRWATQRSDPTAINAEFRQMVNTLHQHGLEVVMDVVYNHTPEGNEFGPTLSFRGLDNASYYLLDTEDRSRCQNLTGCGNTLYAAHPKVTQFVLDSLRYWVEEMGVDGFRFDLAPVLGRNRHGFDEHAAFFTSIRQDPVLARVHLIAEPWDAGPNGYQVGRFPGRFLDWNDKYRDAVRGYWLQKGVGRGEFAKRITASSDLFNHGQRRPSASVNFVSVHDGYTLNDVVSYSQKHNLTNGENNRDGRDGEMCSNYGVEGPTDDVTILGLRQRVRRAMLATLLLSQGTPMLCAGDELGNSQQGNNNAYCQDNATTWLNWGTADQELQQFVAQAAALRRANRMLHFDEWYGSLVQAQGGPRRVWRRPAGEEMQVHDWHDLASHALACELIPASDPQQQTFGEARLWMAFNPGDVPVGFTLALGRWTLVLDSSGVLDRVDADQTFLLVPAHALVVLQQI